MRPLDFLGRIKAKLGIVILLAVAVAILVNEYGRYLGVPGLARMAVAGLISLAMAQLVGRGMTRPLREMAAAAQTIAKGRYDLRVSATSRDEVGELARAFNAMAADLGEVDRQRRELVANVSHELRTPITGLQAVLENVVDGVTPPDRATLSTALAQTERLGRLVAQLLDLSRLDSGARLIEPELFDLAALCRQAVREARFGRDDVSVEYSVPVHVTLYADPALLAQVLANLLDNAVRHSPPDGVVLLRARVTEQTVQIAITDQGPGIPPAERTRVFERFSRLDAGRAADAGGAGLGLAIAKEIVEMHGGSLYATDPDQGAATGCRMIIDLPRSLIVSDTIDPAPALDPPAEPASGGERPPAVAAAREERAAEPLAASAGEPQPATGTGTAAAPHAEPAPARDADGHAPDDAGAPAAGAIPAAGRGETAATAPAEAAGSATAAAATDSGGSPAAGNATATAGDGDGEPASGGGAAGAAAPGRTRPGDTADAGAEPGAAAAGPGAPVTDMPTVPTRIARGSGRAADGGAATGDGGEVARPPAARRLSDEDTLAKGIPVAEVLRYDAAQAAATSPATADSSALSIGAFVGGLLGIAAGFFGGIVAGLLAGAVFDSGGIALATLMFATLGGLVFGSAVGRRVTSAPSRYPATAADASRGAAGPQGGLAGGRDTGAPRPGVAASASGGGGAAERRDPAAAAPQAAAGTKPGAAGQAAAGPGSRTGGRGTGAAGGAPRTGVTAGGPGPAPAGGRRATVPEYVPPSLFPRPVLPPAPAWLLPVAAVVGLVAAVALPYDDFGLGIVVVAVLMGLAVLPAARRRISPWSVAFGLVAYALVAFALFRDADWLVAPLLLAAFGIAALAVSGAGRGWLGAIRGSISVPLAVFQLPWFLAEPVKRLTPRRRLGPAVAGSALTVVLVVIFGVLFASADRVFSSIVESVFRAPVELDSLPARVFAFAVIAALVAAAVLVALRPVAEPAMPDLRLRVSRTLWVMPLTALNLLFAVFVAVQITVLFGGNERVLTTAGLTYAEYARSGFFELATVSVFVLAIVAAACGGLSLERGRDRRLLAALLGPLCALTLVILASALHRLDLYVDAYGLSRLRAVVIATCWWLAAVFLVVLVAGAVWLARGRLGWLPRTVVLLTGVSLVAFAAWNPDLRVAESQHAIRGAARIDADYLGDLGAEAVPALDRLPEPARSCVLRDVRDRSRLDRPEESWSGWNLAREQARDILRRHPIIPVTDCPR